MVMLEFVGKTGHGDDWRCLPTLLGLPRPDPAGSLEAVYDGHLAVHENDVETGACHEDEARSFPIQRVLTISVT